MELWQSKRLFFATPQVIQNDITDPSFPTSTIKLIIVDEAHKAKGKYAYCEVIRAINAVNQKFRVLALSATPGKTADVIEIINNLLISKIEIRTENSIDVKPYTFSKEIIILKVPLGEIKDIRDRFFQIVNPYLRKLLECNAIRGNNFSKGWIVVQQKKFMLESHPQKSDVMKVFSIAVSLLYSLDLLERHGIQLFLSSFSDEGNVTKQKYFVSQDKDLKELLNELNDKFAGTSPLSLNIHTLPSGEVPSIVHKEINYGHPKFEILKQKITQYFENGGSKTIIFCEFRDTVMMVFTLLLQLRPTVLPKMLIGQGGAVSQKDQLAVMKDFRSNKVNVLVTTSVCEEGIDVGEVDLVICFDINSKNPTRFVQRIGRTGRKRNGQVIILAAEGKEEEVIKDVIGSKDSMNKSIHSNREISKNLYRNAPRLVPGNFKPKCVETKFNIREIERESEPTKKSKKPAAKKSKKIVTIASPTLSIASHFKSKLSTASKTSTTEDVNEANNKQDVPMEVFAASNRSIAQECELIKIEYEEQLSLIMQKVEKNEFVNDHLRIYRKRDLEMMENVMKMFNLASNVNETLQLELKSNDLLEESMDAKVFSDPKNQKTAKTNESTVESKINYTFLESQDETCSGFESRYDNQFTYGGPFYTPVKSSPFNICNRILNSTVMPSPLPQTGPSSIKKRSLNKNTPIVNSPLLRAFERQRNISTSTPVAARTSTSSSVATRTSTSTPIANQTSSSTPLDFQSSFICETSVDTSVVTQKSVSATSSVTDKSMTATKKSKTVLEYFGIASIDDIFEGLDSGSDDGGEATTSKTHQSVATSAKEDSVARILDDDNEAFLSLRDDEVVESSVVDEEEPPKKKKKVQTEEKFEFNIDDIFGNSSESSIEFDKNIESLPSDLSQQTQIYEAFEKGNSNGLEELPMKENVVVVNRSVTSVTSPSKSPLQRRPNFSKLMNALKSSNFLSPLPQHATQPRLSPKVSVAYSSPKPSLPTPKITTFLVPSPSTSYAAQSPVSTRVKPTIRRRIPKHVNDSIVSIDDEVRATNSFALPIRKKSSMKRKRNDFLCTQAAVDGTDSSDDDDDGSLDGFVANETIDLSVDDVDMQAKYLESLRSPSVQRGFRMPRLAAPQNMSMIYSQFPNNDEEEDDWELGSFIVDNIDDAHSVDSEPDELEVAERMLKRKRKKAQDIRNGNKRRKVVRIDESSDEEGELEELRKHLNSHPD